MKKGLLFLTLVLCTGVKAGEIHYVGSGSQDDPIIDRLDDEYYQGRTDALWDAAVGLCIQSGTKDLAKCAQSNYEALEAASNEVVIND